MYKKKLTALILLSFVIMGFGFVSIPEAKAQFVISTISALDQYGQGISPSGIDILENSTGSWQYAQAFGGVPSPFNWSAGKFMQVRIETRLNATLTGATGLIDGKNYFRHNITVTNTDSVIVFSANNFTYRTSADVGIYYYSYEVTLNFSPVAGQAYTIDITYEVYY